MTDHAPLAQPTVAIFPQVGPVWVEATDAQGLPRCVRVDAITALSASTTEADGLVYANHDAGESSIIAKVSLSDEGRRLPAVAQRDAVHTSTGVVLRMIASQLAPHLAPSLAYTDEAGAPGGGA